MPSIFDNIDIYLLPTLRKSLELCTHADFCVGYFNLRGWKSIDDIIELWPGGEGRQCRLLIGMQKLPHDELREALNSFIEDNSFDNQTALTLKKKLAEEFHHQLTLGIPTNKDEDGLKRLANQLRSNKVIVKLHLRHTLHAKLYLMHRSDPVNPIIGYLGSSNLTLAGLSEQGELNVDILEKDAAQKLSTWFNTRWNDRWCIDITQELIRIIEESWAREDLVPPYYIYLKMAYHLSQEARTGLSEFRIPREFGNRLFDYQVAAVKIAASHLNKRNGVIIGDVVGLGKTLMATALAKIFQDDYHMDTLIICPKNLVKMWENYCAEYRLLAKVLPLTKVLQELPQLRRYRIVLIDESHNLRNREGKRYRTIQEYIQTNDSKCILLSATPYNKTYLDLSSQLRLFIPDDKDIGIRPEKLIRELGEDEFIRQHQCPIRSLSAFEKSFYIDDWRELMRQYMVRRTRSFIQDNYAVKDHSTNRKYLIFDDGTRSYFPDRIPKTIDLGTDKYQDNIQYSQLFSMNVVDAINSLKLPRYGLANYDAHIDSSLLKSDEIEQLRNFSRAGKRLMGFCRTNLFKRLESSGEVFLKSIERHILRNYIYMYAIERDLPIPIGTQEASVLDLNESDEDLDTISFNSGNYDVDIDIEYEKLLDYNNRDFATHASRIYERCSTRFWNRFKWIRPVAFTRELLNDLSSDSKCLGDVLTIAGKWNPDKDTKLKALYNLINNAHPKEKIIVFTQFADTVNYLVNNLRSLGIRDISGVTGKEEDPTSYAWRFSPESNDRMGLLQIDDELRCLISTDVLSEGQNLQDAHIIVNYDLPWAIIRLVQRAGRVDRIGQKSERIICYSFLPADGVENLIHLRERVRQRLQENAEVVGTDEEFFEDETERQKLVDLYSEKAGVLDDTDTDVDLASYAYQIWKNAIDKNRELQKIIPSLPNVVYSIKEHHATSNQPYGALVYLRTNLGNDMLTWIDENGSSISESQFEILKAAECTLSTESLQRTERHHELTKEAVKFILKEERSIGGQLGRPSGARYRTYIRLKQYANELKDTLFNTSALIRAIEDIYKYPLKQSAIDTLNRQLKSNISDAKLAELVMDLRDDDRLCYTNAEDIKVEPELICSLGLAPAFNERKNG